MQGPITFKPNDSPKWLHLRGLYVDYLEPSALQAINDAKTNCPDSSQKENCVLRVLPFTSINLTELGTWTPRTSENASIVVASNNFGETLGSVEPIRGKVSRVGSPTVDQQLNGVSTLRRSNSGLTTLGNGIDTTDASTTVPDTWTATQPFVVQGGGDTTGELFKVKLGGEYTFPVDNKLYINSSPSAACNAAISADADTSLGAPPNPYTCSSGTLGVLAHTLTVGRYNYPLPEGSSTAALTCKDSTPGSTATLTYTPTEGYPVRTCRNYAVTGVALNGAALTGPWPEDSGTDGKLDEATSITVGVISKDDKVTISFGTPVDTVQTPVCTYIPNPDGDDTTADETLFTVAVPTCP